MAATLNGAMGRTGGGVVGGCDEALRPIVGAGLLSSARRRSLGELCIERERELDVGALVAGTKWGLHPRVACSQNQRGACVPP